LPHVVPWKYLDSFFLLYLINCSPVGERQPNWTAKGIWFRQIFVPSCGWESCQGNGWKGMCSAH
jgi:hypothetical protein